MINRTFTVFGIAALFTLVVFTAIVPAVMVSNASKGPAACDSTATWTTNISPGQEYTPGSALSLSVTEACPGSGSATITTPTGTSTVSFICPCTAQIVYSASPTTAGAYSVSANIAGQQYSTSFMVGFTVTPEFPIGALLAVLAPLAAIFGYVQFRKPAIKKL
jgi:hypothetical protein